jgi:hypothetical protein
MAVMRPPRLAGDRKPSTAKHIVMDAMPSSCTPVPAAHASVPASAGGRKTSPCTIFHPLSSAASSTLSSSLYWLMSRRSVRTMIMATMPDRKRTIMSELTMENQWMLSSLICRYVSQRDAQRMSLALNATSYVNTTSSLSATGCGAPARLSSGCRSALHVSSCGFTGSHRFLYRCFTLAGSTSKPTMRDRSVSGSRLYRMVKRAWLCR